MLAESGPDGAVEMREIDPRDPELAKDPELAGDAAGKLRVENDDQVLIVIAADQAAYDYAQRIFRDAAALAQEHMIPHQPSEGPKDEA